MSNALLKIQNRLKDDATLQVEWVGEGKAEFLFVRSPSRAVEISVDVGGIFVEYWDDANEQSDVAPVKSEVLPSTAEALANVFKWLR